MKFIISQNENCLFMFCGNSCVMYVQQICDGIHHSWRLEIVRHTQLLIIWREHSGLTVHVFTPFIGWHYKNINTSENVTKIKLWGLLISILWLVLFRLLVSYYVCLAMVRRTIKQQTKKNHKIITISSVFLFVFQLSRNTFFCVDLWLFFSFWLKMKRSSYRQ